MSKVREDIHGLYVRTNGCVYRPIPTKYSYPIYFNGKWLTGKQGTEIISGQECKLNVMRGAPFVKVNNKELWHNHGNYIGKESKDCYINAKS